MIYERKNDKDIYHPLSEDTLSLLDLQDDFLEFKAKFTKGG